MRTFALALTLSIFFSACGDFRGKMDAQFGDQHFKTAIALIELHKVRFGTYPDSLSELRFLGSWDLIALSSVKYARLADGYELDVVQGWVGRPELTYPREFWNGLGVRKTNVRSGSASQALEGERARRGM